MDCHPYQAAVGLSDYLWCEKTPEEREAIIRLNLETDTGAVQACSDRVAQWKTLLAVDLLEKAINGGSDIPEFVRGILKQHRRRRDAFRMSEEQHDAADRFLMRNQDHGPVIDEMNERAQIGDPFELSLAFSRHLGRRDRCLLADAIVDELGPYAPIPAFDDVREDAVHWLESVPDAVRRVYLLELWHALSQGRQAAALKFFAENGKEK